MDRTPEGNAYTELILTVLRFWSSVDRHGRAITAPFGQTPARWQVLGGIWGEPRTVPQVARRMGLTRQSVQRVANTLVDEGLVVFLPNPEHQRSPLLGLTDRGTEVIEGIDGAQVQWSNRIASGLVPEEMQSAANILQDIAKRLDDAEL